MADAYETDDEYESWAWSLVDYFTRQPSYAWGMSGEEEYEALRRLFRGLSGDTRVTRVHAS